jgi:hypothetical protein
MMIDISQYNSIVRFNSLTERGNALAVWSMCYRDHPDYWRTAWTRRKFYEELNLSATLAKDLHQAIAPLIGQCFDETGWRRADELLGSDGRLGRAEHHHERAEGMWAAERRRVAERRSPTYRRLRAHLQWVYDTPIVWESGIRGWVCETDEFHAARDALEDLDFARAEPLIVKAERKARAIVLRAERARRRCRVNEGNTQCQ